MNTINEQKTTPNRPYDDSSWDRWTMYDEAPFIWDIDLCREMGLTLVSGNIIKAYQCLLAKPYEVKH